MPPQSCPSVGVTTLGFHGKHTTTFYIISTSSREERGNLPLVQPPRLQKCSLPSCSPRDGLFHCNMLYVANFAFF